MTDLAIFSLGFLLMAAILTIAGIVVDKKRYDRGLYDFQDMSYGLLLVGQIFAYIGLFMAMFAWML